MRQRRCCCTDFPCWLYDRCSCAAEILPARVIKYPGQAAAVSQTGAPLVRLLLLLLVVTACAGSRKFHWGLHLVVWKVQQDMCAPCLNRAATTALLFQFCNQPQDACVFPIECFACTYGQSTYVLTRRSVRADAPAVPSLPVDVTKNIHGQGYCNFCPGHGSALSRLLVLFPGTIVP
jgi:hypothetical protein